MADNDPLTPERLSELLTRLDEVMTDAARLRRHVFSGHHRPAGIERNLTRQEQQVAGPDGLGVRTDRRWSGCRGNRVLHGSGRRERLPGSFPSVKPGPAPERRPGPSDGRLAGI